MNENANNSNIYFDIYIAILKILFGIYIFFWNNIIVTEHSYYFNKVAFCLK